MITKEIKIKIFAEYIGCIATNNINEIKIVPSNIEELINMDYKIKLKSVYDLTKEEMFDIAEEMRYNRALPESFRDFNINHFRISSESRNKSNFNTAMISYVAITNDGQKGNWFSLSNSYGVGELKAKNYDVGSCWAYVMNNNFKKRCSLEEIGLAIIY